MFNPNPDMMNRPHGAPFEAKKLLADLLMEAILGSDLPEETKIEVRIMQAYGEFDELALKTVKTFACPIPSSDEALRDRIYPARQAFLEYLKLMKGGLENFLVNVPVPEIPPEYLKRTENPFDRI